MTIVPTLRLRVNYSLDQICQPFCSRSGCYPGEIPPVRAAGSRGNEPRFIIGQIWNKFDPDDVAVAALYVHVYGVPINMLIARSSSALKCATWDFIPRTVCWWGLVQDRARRGTIAGPRRAHIFYYILYADTLCCCWVFLLFFLLRYNIIEISQLLWPRVL